ncbi:MAG: PKD domain-containing protein [Anaerolineales bacterium]|nr:PKD domain-containing protein [Anaerolineales bacterium]
MNRYRQPVIGLVFGFCLFLIAWGTVAGSEIQVSMPGHSEPDSDDIESDNSSGGRGSKSDPAGSDFYQPVSNLGSVFMDGKVARSLLAQAGKSLTTIDTWVVRVYFGDRDQIGQIIIGREPWEVDLDGGYLVMEATAAEIERLEGDGFVVEIDQKLTVILNQPYARLPGQTTGIPGFSCYRTVEETYASAEALANDHPKLATWIDIGNSWEKEEPGGNEGYDLMVLKLTNAAIPGPKPALFVSSGIHAREYAPVELNMRFAEYLIDNYGIDADVTWLLDYHQIHLLFNANPDGRKHAENYPNISERYWRKNTNNNFCGGTNNRGVDLNRNFSFSWYQCGNEECSSSNPCYDTYRGPSGGSEYETQAVENYLLTLFPDQREDELSAAALVTSTGVFIDVHSYAKEVIWPWGFTPDLPPNAADTQTLGRKFAFFNEYKPYQASGIGYLSDGATDDFAYGTLGVAAYTFEIGTSFFQSCTSFESTIYPDNLEALLFAARVARTPYITPGGPDALNLSVPGFVIPGEPAQLSATLDDTRYNNTNGTEPTQIIAAAEFYLDDPPWITSTLPVSFTMQVADGVWDEKIEDVQATLDTGDLDAGRHILYFRGQDADGVWGPVSAAFVNIMDPAELGVISGIVRDIETGNPIEAVISAGVFMTRSNAATGLYHLSVLSGTYDLLADADGYAIEEIEGVNVQASQNVILDWNLLKVCGQELINDDVESGNLGWQAETPWAITTEQAHSSSHAWTDSPGGNYANNIDASLSSPVFDIPNFQDVVLSFWHSYDIEPINRQATANRYDYGAVEFSTDGVSWTEITYYEGLEHTTWEFQQFSLPELAGQSHAQIRFHLHSDESVNKDGWYIDDVVLAGTGPACPPLPVAAFDSPDSVFVGQAITFTNLTTGGIKFEWDFGDGEQTTLPGNPTHTYNQPGNYTVTLTATNSAGNDSASRMIGVNLFWDTSANYIHWTDELSVTGQTSETLVLVDVVTATGTITWTQSWDPSRLELDGCEQNPIGESQVVSGTGVLTWTIPGIGTPVTHFLTRTMIIKPCSWQTATATLEIWTDDGMSEQRSLLVKKFQPVLELSGRYSPEIEPGGTVTFTLIYSNTGGLENDVMLQTVFPAGSYLYSASPEPDDVDPSGSPVAWNLGILAKDQWGEVRITTVITNSLQPGDKVVFSSVLYDHTGAEGATSITQFQVHGIVWQVYLPFVVKE